MYHYWSIIGLLVVYCILQKLINLLVFPLVPGTLISNPPKPKNTFENQNVGNFSRTSSGGAFVITNVPSGPIPDTYSPSKITDLNAIIEGQIVKLSWTATGDDLDKGNGMIFLK